VLLRIGVRDVHMLVHDAPVLMNWVSLPTTTSTVNVEGCGTVRVRVIK
jgi:hypothetical protein